MKFPRCNTNEDEKGAKFCHVCGAILQTDFSEASKCPTCGAAQPARTVMGFPSKMNLVIL